MIYIFKYDGDVHIHKLLCRTSSCGHFKRGCVIPQVICQSQHMLPDKLTVFIYT